jgi:very-short-patch-repair endonuclease
VLGSGVCKCVKITTMKRQIIPYNPKLKELARKLRNNSTLSEVLLWKHLNRKQMKGYDFHRQKPLDNYIVDFFCHELMLAIEIDGDSHDHKQETDLIRQQRLESLGITVLRFYDSDVKHHIEGVLQTLQIWIEKYEEGRVYSPLLRG